MYVYSFSLEVWFAGIDNNKQIPARKLIGAWMPNSGFHPILGSRAPAMTAPSETPTVIPELTRAMYNPRRLGEVICMTMILATMRIPPPPAPVNARPTMKVLKEFEIPVMAVPIQIKTVEKNMQSRGLNTCESRPIRGASEDMAMRYDEVSHVAFSNASRSAAIDD
jgi:hypothetical protein